MMARLKRGLFLGPVIGLALGATTWLDFHMEAGSSGPMLSAEGVSNVVHAFGLLAIAFLWIWQAGPILSPAKEATA